MRRPGRGAVLAIAALLAACQPLPHPFEDDRPPAALLKIRDVPGVSIAPIEGEPAAVAAKLGAAMAKALLKRDIPASDKTASLGSYVLHGGLARSRPSDGKASLTVFWRLTDAKGRAMGEHSAKLEAKAADLDAGKDAVVDQLAAVSADGVAPLLQDEAPVKAAAAPAPPEDRRLRVAVNRISGAPGDGATALAAAVESVLKRRDLAIVEAGGRADLVVEGEIAVAPVKPDKQHVKILWRVRRADGAEIGTVGQENDVPRGTLDGSWGDLAYAVATAAGDGLMQLISRAAAAGKS